MPILKREPDLFPDDIFSLELPWYVAHVRSRQEKAFSRYLAQFGVPYYLPQMEKRVRRSGRTIVSFLPLFSGYAFFRGNQDAAARALRSNLVANLLTPPDQAQFDAELRQIHELQSKTGNLIPHPYLGIGDAVMIGDGPFKGYRGVVVREKGSERLVVSLSFIKQSVLVDLDREFVSPV